MLKAYTIYDRWGEKGCMVVWAKSAGGAKMQVLYSEPLFEGLEFLDLYTKRMECWDKYADTKHIPVKEMLKEGWRWNCCECGREDINQEMIDKGEAFFINPDKEDDFATGEVICKECKFYKGETEK